MSCHLVTIKIVNIYLDTIKEKFSKICCVVGSGNGSRKYSKVKKVFFVGIDNENVFLSKLTGNEHGLID